ncbi:MAG: alpha-2-macroglobulin family protein [Bacteroidota bacterium]
MKKITVFSSVLLCLFLCSFCTAQKNKDTKNSMINYDNGDYEAAWKTIDSLENEGLPQSALVELEQLYERVKDKDDPTTIWRCLIYRSKYTTQLEEDGFVKSIQNLEAELAKASFPLQPLLQSTLASLYRDYLNNNFWQIRERSERGEFDPTFDILSWSPGQLIDRSRTLYLASLSDDRIRTVGIKSLDPITSVPRETDNLRPTLYDLLAFRAIDHLSSGQSFLTEPVYKFNLLQAEALAPAADFIAYEFNTRDSSSQRYQTVLLFQDLLRHHLKDDQPEAFIDANLKRLTFAYQQSTRSDKRVLYLKSLEDLARQYEKRFAFAEICAAVATVYVELAQNYQAGPEAEGRDAYLRAYDYCRRGIERFPKSFGADQCRAIESQILQKSLRMQSEEVNLPERDFPVLLSYRNVQQVWLRIVPLSDSDWDKYQDRSYGEQLPFLRKLPAQKTWSIDLPNPQDYHQHSVEVKVDGLPVGRYAILVADNEAFTEKEHAVGYLFTQITQLTLMQRPGGRGNYEFVVADRSTGAPVAGATIQTYLQGNRNGGRRWIWSKGPLGQTDADGYLSMSITERKGFTVEVKKDADRYVPEQRLRTYFESERSPQRFTQFFLDRQIYRPGQTIYFKALVMEKDAQGKPRILRNERVTIQFFDANYQVVETVELRTNRFGSVQGSFTAPRIGLLGQMRLNSTPNGSISFRVEEYKRPKFEVVIDQPERAYRLGERVVVKGNAKAYAGNNIDGAQVQYRVVRRVSYPYFPWWRWSSWRPQRPEMEILNGVTTTGADGSFEVSFVAEADPTSNPKYRAQFDFQILADVTDPAGETRSGSTKVSVGYLALKIDLPLAKEIDLNELDSLSLSTTNLSGVFEAAEGRIIIEKLGAPAREWVDKRWPTPDQQLYSQEEYYQFFPHLAQGDENRPENFPIERTIEQNRFNTANSKRIPLDRGRYEVGWYKLTLRTQDRYGAKLEQEKYFQIYDATAGKLAPGTPLLFRQNQTRYEVGDRAELLLGTSFAGQQVLLELEHQGKSLRRLWLSPAQFARERERIVEQYRGNVHYSIRLLRHNRVYQEKGSLVVPWSNKDLQLEYVSFRDKLYPGAPEKWQIKVTGPQKDRVAAEVLAAMYDASLDAFAPNDWRFSHHPTSYAQLDFRQLGYGLASARIQQDAWNRYYRSKATRGYRDFNWFGFYYNSFRNIRMGMAGAAPSAAPRSAKRESGNVDTMATFDPESGEMAFNADGDLAAESLPSSEPEPTDGTPGKDGETDFSEVPVRTNLNETVFFLPELKTDAEGNVIVEFTMNEALTRWKFLLFAHTPDLEFGIGQREVVTQKELMVQPNSPRFLREGDEIVWTAKVSNLSEKDLNGTARLQLFDALTMQPIDSLLDNPAAEASFNAPSGQSTTLRWRLRVPEGQVSAIVHRVVAKATNAAGDTFSDGEESALPVLTNRMLVTESLPLTVWGQQERTYVFDRLREAAQSPSLRHHRLTLEFSSNPAWYAVQSLPYLMEYPYECTEQIFSRFYANSLASSVATAHPRVRDVFLAWKGSEALLSNLAKNEELKSALLEETPWVLDAQSEAQQRQNIALLFDLNRMAEEQTKSLQQLLERQEADGGFSWFPGGRSNWYITQYLVEGLGHLDQLGVKYPQDQDLAQRLTTAALRFIDLAVAKRYRELKRSAEREQLKLEEDHLGNLEIHYLYARSFFPGVPLHGEAEPARDYFLEQARQYWLKKGTQQQGLLSLALHRYADKETPSKILRSLSERAIRHDDLGMYWKMPAGYYWHEHPIETQALLIEAYQEITKDKNTVDQLRAWLLKNKQTNRWKTTKATAAAVYALLIDDQRQRVNSWLLDEEALQVSVGGERMEPGAEEVQAGTGYFKTSWRAQEIRPELAEVQLKNDNDVLAWGALYWQYFEDLDKITSFEETPLQLRKQLFVQRASDRGPVLEALSAEQVLEPGDKLIVRIELRVDRPMEYIHLKDLRGSGFEPINVLSQYKWQDGLGYYESTRDLSTNFFMDYLPRGTYVFEYPLRATHAGEFSNGISTIQCMYAPEFSSHSEGTRVRIK